MPRSEPQPAESGSHPVELGGWRLVELLGRGGMGEVWRADREGPGGIRRRGALKRVLPRLANDPGLRQRFLAEARTNSRLEHPNIVQVLDFGDRPEPYLVLEFIEGTTAADLLAVFARSHTRLPAIAAAFIAAEVATGLHYAHRKKDDSGQPLGIVHRDVSPQNVLISVEGGVKIGDFGVARAADNTFRTQEGVSVGKLVYMSPEQVAGQPFDARADVFALGVVLWELLTIQPMLARDDPPRALQQLLHGDFRAPSQVDPRLPPAIDQLVMQALARDPSQRHASAAAFAQAARAFVHAMSPGFDSTELVRILGRLVPSVAFQAPTPPPRNAPAATWSTPPVVPPAAPAPMVQPAYAPPVASALASPSLQRISHATQPQPPIVRRGLSFAGLVAIGCGALAVGAAIVAAVMLLDRSVEEAKHTVTADRAPLARSAATAAPPAADNALLRAGVQPAAFAGHGSAALGPEATMHAQLEPLRDVVRACVTLHGPEHVLRLDILYDGVAGSVHSVATTLDGADVDATSARCIEDIVRSAVRVGTTPATLEVQQSYAY